MIFNLEGLTVYFPYEYVYPEQYKYMLELKHGLDAKGHGCLEMPTGTGKTITCLALITSYQLAHPECGKLIYCTRTVPEMEKVLAELRVLQAYREKHVGKASEIMALGLSSRKNMCIHPRVADEGSRESVDARCRRLTASWVREKHMDCVSREEETSTELCQFFEDYEKEGPDAVLPPGVYTLADLREFGRKKGWCPYFLARHMIGVANVVVYNYQYLLDPKVSSLVSRELEKECVVVFDEAHNIDNVCIEALSVNLRQQTLDAAGRNITSLSGKIERAKQTDARRLREEYARLVDGLAQQGVLRRGGGEDALQNPVIPDDILREAVPGNIRRAEHFVAFLRRFVEYLKTRMRATQVEQETPAAFLAHLQRSAAIDGKTLKFCYDRLTSLLKTLEIVDTEEYNAVSLVADFGTLVGTYQAGFSLILEPYDERYPNIPDPVFQLCCLDASLAVRPVFEKFQSVFITSGTLSPIELYPRLLSFNPVCISSLPMTLTRECLCPVVITRGADQQAVSTKFDMRDDPGVIQNYGRILIDLAATVPDGLVAFFVSYSYMEQIVSKWHETGVLQQVMQHKLVFIETQDVVETSLALDNYRRACNCGRGAVFLSVARGKVAEGIDFDRHYGRAVIMYGVPYQYTLSRVLRARLEYLRETFQIKEADFLAFDAVRQAAQCVGRVIRSKADYGLMVFADKRYNSHDKRGKLPGWITTHLHEQQLNLSTDMAVQIARAFMREMAQPYDRGVAGKQLLDQAACDALAKQAGFEAPRAIPPARQS
jgi:DNA excision repair protein ERCC-2|mmetsp:Transcript_14049/g.60169  ORF Transcript_14049/g.60169 Transcript_14049/m.60169 type:complete len:772 (-) Transcript_14049:95-2410(-)